MRLQNKVALITGAAAGIQGELMGFGGAAAWLFTQEGAKVVLTDILDEAGEKTAAQIREQGGEAIYVHLDVTDEDQWANAIKAAIDAYGKLDILINNAGIGSRGDTEGTTVLETPENAWDAHMDVHAKGCFLGTKAVIPDMRKNGGGSIINTSSIYGIIGSQGSAAYHAAKGASRIFTKSAAIQYASDNIRVNSVHPGFAATPMTLNGFNDPERYSATLSRVPMGRMGTPQDIANGMLYLASDESSYVTGAELVIDGGVTAQ